MDRVLDPVVDLDAGRAALVIGEQVTTYGELDVAVRRSAVALREAGVRPGQRVPLVDDASLLSVATLLAATRLGAATALMNPRLTPGELAELMAVAATGSVAVCGPAYRDTVARAAKESGATVLSEEELLHPEIPPEDVGAASPHPPEAEAVIIFTSGTTGTPKPVPFTHGLMAPRIAAFSPTVDERPSVGMMCVPLVHIGGMLGLMVALGRGATEVVLTRFDAGRWLELVERHRVQSVFLVPTMLHRILDHDEFERRDVSSLVAISFGAAPASPDLVRRAQAAFPGAALSNTFGQTETMGSITALTPDDLARGKEASVGRPLPGVEIRVVDPTNGEDVATGTVGELWVRTSASVILPSSGGGDGVSAPPGWLRTGDMVSVDEEGYLYPSGRLSETINRGGEKFAPLEIETVLRRHPAVRDVAVVGVPDAEMGSRVGVAAVVREPVELEELRRFCQGQLANFKFPERLVLVDDIPYNDFGKVARNRVRELVMGATP